MTGRDALRAAMATADVVMGEAVGAHGVTVGMDVSIVRTPLSESATVGAALGMALAGKRVVVELIDPRGVFRAAEAIAEAGDLLTRSAGAFRGALVVVMVVGAADAIPTVPAGVVLCVAGVAGAIAPALASAFAAPTPTIVCVAASALDQTVGAANGSRRGDGVSILAIGEGVPLALATEGPDVVDLGDAAAASSLGESVRRTGRVVILTHGDTSPVSDVLASAFWHLEAPPAFVRAVDGAEALSRAIATTLDA